jgi:hypothetical protein
MAMSNLSTIECHWSFYEPYFVDEMRMQKILKQAKDLEEQGEIVRGS